MQVKKSQIEFRNSIILIQLFSFGLIYLYAYLYSDTPKTLDYISVIPACLFVFIGILISKIKWFYAKNRIVFGIFCTSILGFITFSIVELILHYFKNHILCADKHGMALISFSIILIYFIFIALFYKLLRFSFVKIFNI
jgi:hypothetical protein